MADIWRVPSYDQKIRQLGRSSQGQPGSDSRLPMTSPMRHSRRWTGPLALLTFSAAALALPVTAQVRGGSGGGFGSTRSPSPSDEALYFHVLSRTTFGPSDFTPKPSRVRPL